jgi:hypothetical protein
MYLGIVVGCRMYVLQPCSKTFNKRFSRIHTVVDFVFPDETSLMKQKTTKARPETMKQGVHTHITSFHSLKNTKRATKNTS